MDLRQLRYFVAIAELGKMTLAAERLFVTQPALSREVKALEGEFGVSLFERKYNQLRLTSAGEVLLSQARLLLRQAEQTQQLMKEASTGSLGYLRVAAEPSAMLHVVLPSVARFRQLRPEFDIQLMEEANSSCVSYVEHGYVDIGLVTPLPGYPHLCWEPLYDARVYALLSLHHRLSTKTSISVEELAHERLLLINTGSPAGFVQELIFHIHGMQAATVFESSVPETVLRAAAMQLGIAVVTDSVSFDRSALRAVPVLDAGGQVQIPVVAAWHKDGDLPEVTMQFVALLKQYATQRPVSCYRTDEIILSD